MKTDIAKAKEVDSHILDASGLIKDKRGYNAMIILLSTGVLMNERLGEKGTVDFTRVLDKLNVEYRFIPFGLELRENAKLNYYNNVMNKSIRQNLETINITYNQNNRNLSVGKDEKEGWLRTRNLKNDE